MLKLDLKSLLEEMRGCRNQLKEKDEKIKILQLDISNSMTRNIVLEDTHSILLSEVSKLNTIIKNLQDSFKNFAILEDEKTKLLSEAIILKTALQEKEQCHQTEVEKFELELEKVKTSHQEELKANLLQSEKRATSQLNNCLNEIKDKENRILSLQNEICEIKKEKEQELLKMQFEYDDKLNKLKAKISKTKGTSSLQDDFKKNDVFRQKFIQIEKESKEETLKLRKQIADLQLQIQNLKSVSHFTRNVDSISEDVRSNNAFEKMSENFMPQEKRFRAEAIHKDSSDYSNDFSAKPNGIVRPLKKKLFNPDVFYEKH